MRVRRAKREEAVAVGERYLHHLKEETWSGKRAILAIPIYLLFVLVISALLFAGLGAVLSALGHGDAYWNAIRNVTPEKLPHGERITDLVLFALFPAGMLTNRLLFKSKGGSLMSVTGSVRWKWLLQCVLVLLPLMSIALVVQAKINQPFEAHLTTTAMQAIGITLILTPLQCMGEEMVFRGWGLQTFGPLFRRAGAGWIVLGLVLSVVFSVLHGAGNLLVSVELFLFAALACALIYITGGMEAGIVMHSINNSVLFIISALSKDSAKFAPEDASNAAAGIDALMTMVADVVFFLLVVWLWKRYQKKEECKEIA